jgi:hypothetical protein
MSHTPGPWTVPHFAKEDSGCHCGYVFDNEGEYTVCEVFFQDESDEYGQNPPIDQAKANARIIAAAPDLADVAYMVLDTATDSTPPELVAAAEAALRKAGKIK